MPQGMFGFVSFNREAVWGTTATRGETDHIRFLSESMVREIEQIQEPEIWYIADETPHYEGVTTAKGDIVLLARPFDLGILLNSCLGPPTTTGSGPYTHVFLPVEKASEFHADCPLVPYTVQVHRDFGITKFSYRGSVVDSLTLEIGVNQKALKATASIIAKEPTTPTNSITPSYEVDPPFLWYPCTVSIAGGADLTLEAMKFKFSNNLEAVQALNNTKLIAKILRGNFRTVEMELVFSVPTLTEYARFTGQGEAAFSLNLNPTGNANLTIKTSKMRYTAFPLGTSGPGRYTVAVAAKAKYDATLTGALKVTLVNDAPSYNLYTRVLDTFTRSDSTTLGSTEKGSKSWAEDAGDLAISSNKLVATTLDASDMAVASCPAGYADGTFRLHVNLGADGADRSVGILFRMTDADNYIMAELKKTGAGVESIDLIKREATVESSLGTAVQAITADTQYEIKVVTLADSIKVYVDGSLKIDITSVFNQAATIAGIRFGDNVVVGCSADNFRVETASTT